MSKDRAVLGPADHRQGLNFTPSAMEGHWVL